jgi:hypothetical protein
MIDAIDRLVVNKSLSHKRALIIIAPATLRLTQPERFAFLSPFVPAAET